MPISKRKMKIDTTDNDHNNNVFQKIYHLRKNISTNRSLTKQTLETNN